MKPNLSISLVAGQPLIAWKKQGMDGIEIFKRSADSDWVMLIFDQRPNHLDNNPLPAEDTKATWTYKAIYRFQDERVGQWSDEVIVVVSGAV